MEENKRVFMSNEIAEISAALTEFQCAIEHPKLEKEVSVKTRSGSSYKFKYADLSCEGCHTGAQSIRVGRVSDYM